MIGMKEGIKESFQYESEIIFILLAENLITSSFNI